MSPSDSKLGMEELVKVIQDLSLARSLPEIVNIVRHAARRLTGADGATFVLRDNELCYYVDEDAIGPLWKGKKFPMSDCISGWAMLNRSSVVIEDISVDSRIPMDAYRPTFVKSLLMVPIRKDRPIGAIGNYWAKSHFATPQEIEILEALASSTSIALENVGLINELRDTNEYLADSLRARDEFFSIASHELRTPITAIKLELELNSRKSENGQFFHSLQQINKLATMVEQLLDVSNLSLKKDEPQLESVNLSELIFRTVEKMRPELEGSGCVISLDIDEQVNSMVDRESLEKVTKTILSNVARHAPGAEVKIILCWENENNIQLIVEDNGPGLSPEVQHSMNQPFARSHIPRKLGGLGLGLFITKHLMSSMKGVITFSASDSGIGTRVLITLPKKA